MNKASARFRDWSATIETDAFVELAAADGPADEAGVWPTDLWRILTTLGATRWSLPERGSGRKADRCELIRRYVKIAEASLTAAFILTQHDAAVRRLAVGTGEAARGWLDAIGQGTAIATVGISQLTTSRRHGTRAMVVNAESNGRYRLDGVMPWVTAAPNADVIVTGGVLDSGDQLLVAIPRDRFGMTVQPALRLAALQASCTSEVNCAGVIVEPREVLAGPAADIAAIPGLAGTGGLETSALALGQARAAIVALAEETTRRDDLHEPIDALTISWCALAADILAAAEGMPDAATSARLRHDCNDLVLRCTQAYLTARKGTGFLRSEPAQRWARQALFFLVWSCPTPVARAALRDLAGLCPV